MAQIREDGGAAVAVAADLSDEAACEAVVRAAVDAFGRLDALVNNAGVQPVQPLETMSLADWRAVVDLNLGATFACTQAAARVMAAAGGGSITHIASIERIPACVRPRPLRRVQGGRDHACTGGRDRVRTARRAREHGLSRADPP